MVTVEKQYCQASLKELIGDSTTRGLSAEAAIRLLIYIDSGELSADLNYFKSIDDDLLREVELDLFESPTMRNRLFLSVGRDPLAVRVIKTRIDDLKMLAELNSHTLFSLIRSMENA